MLPAPVFGGRGWPFAPPRRAPEASHRSRQRGCPPPPTPHPSTAPARRSMRRCLSARSLQSAKQYFPGASRGGGSGQKAVAPWPLAAPLLRHPGTLRLLGKPTWHAVSMSPFGPVSFPMPGREPARPQRAVTEANRWCSSNGSPTGLPVGTLGPCRLLLSPSSLPRPVPPSPGPMAGAAVDGLGRHLCGGGRQRSERGPVQATRGPHHTSGRLSPSAADRPGRGWHPRLDRCRVRAAAVHRTAASARPAALAEVRNSTTPWTSRRSSASCWKRAGRSSRMNCPTSRRT